MPELPISCPLWLSQGFSRVKQTAQVKDLRCGPGVSNNFPTCLCQGLQPGVTGRTCSPRGATQTGENADILRPPSYRFLTYEVSLKLALRNVLLDRVAAGAGAGSGLLQSPSNRNLPDSILISIFFIFLTPFSAKYFPALCMYPGA